MKAKLPLESVRILDLSRVLAGPLCGMMLGDLGASVIKVERPDGGDESRGWGPPFDARGESAYFLSTNRNKLSIGLDLDRPADHMILRSLIEGADVVLDNFKLGTLEKKGLDPAAFLQADARLIWCTISGFGPDSKRPGYDFVVQAEAGWMSIGGEPDGSPMKTGVALADVLAGKDAAIAILAALVARGRPADGLAGADAVLARRLHVSLLDSAAAALINVAQNALVSGSAPKRWGNAHANLVPYELFQARDRPLVIAVGNDAQWVSCCAALELTQLGASDDLRENSGRVVRRQEVVTEIARRVAESDAQDWMERLASRGVPCGLVRTVPEVLSEVASSPLFGMASSVGGVHHLAPPRLDEHGQLVRRHLWSAFDELGPGADG